MFLFEVLDFFLLGALLAEIETDQNHTENEVKRHQDIHQMLTLDVNAADGVDLIGALEVVRHCQVGARVVGQGYVDVAVVVLTPAGCSLDCSCDLVLAVPAVQLVALQLAEVKTVEGLVGVGGTEEVDLSVGALYFERDCVGVDLRVLALDVLRGEDSHRPGEEDGLRGLAGFKAVGDCNSVANPTAQDRHTRDDQEYHANVAHELEVKAQP